MIDEYSEIRKRVRRIPLLLKEELFGSVPDSRIFEQFLALAEKDYVFEELLDYIRRDFPRWLSCQEPCDLTDEEKEILCALAFEVIAIFDKNPNIAVLVCMMFCCWHEPEDDVHKSFNLDSALGVLHKFCFLNLSPRALNLLHEAAFSFALYYKGVPFFASVLVYLCTCDILQKKPDYERILQHQLEWNRKSAQELSDAMNWEMNYLRDMFFLKSSALKKSLSLLEHFRDYLMKTASAEKKKTP